MSLFLGQVISILTAPPGNLVYHIVLVFSTAGALQFVVHSYNSSHFPQVRRAVIGLIIILGLQLLDFLISGFPRLGLLDSQVVLPPLDRTVTLLMLVWIAWLWAFPEPERLADAATLLLSLLGIVLFGLTLAFWSGSSSASFNLTWFETGWQAISLAVVLLGAAAVILRKPNGWGYGLAMFVLAFIGHLATLIYPTSGNLPGLVRLAQMGMFPILFTLSQRFPAPLQAPTPVAKPGKPDEQLQERRRYSTDPKTFHALMTLAAETDSTKIGQDLTRSIAQAMLSDLCFLIMIGEDKVLSIACGYDLIREEYLGNAAVDRNSIPLLANAIQRGRPLRLPASTTSSDLRGLGQILNLNNPGNLLNVPITSLKRGPLGSVLILSPYSNRMWSADDQAYLTNVASLFVPILERSERAASLETERDRALKESQILVGKATEARAKYEQLNSDLETQLQNISSSAAQVENEAALMAAQAEAQRTIDELKAEVERLRSAPAVEPSNGQMERELRQTLEEMANMQNALADANIKLLELEKRPETPITSEQVEVIASISQELRQPMSSIIGYTDLLMGESVGNLSSLQRKFIERIKASTERIGGLVDDLIQTTNLDTGKMEFKPEPIDLNLIIDNAMAYTSTQIREKNITLRLDLAVSAPPIQTDRDALQQILIHLLQNATAATQSEGNITLRVQMKDDNQNHFLSIQVTDNGGGIASEDIPRVFARRYRAEHSLIQGLGDTGVGLSIARALVEAQGGRIWVETEAGVGSTFSVLMPVVIEAQGSAH